MLSLFRTLSLRYLFRHWVRAGLIIASIALGVAAWVTTEVLYTTLLRSLHQAATPLRGTADLYVTNQTTLTIDGSLAERLQREVSGIDRIDPLIIEHAKVVTDQAPGNDVVVLGLRIPQDEEKHNPLDERDIELVSLDREALRRGML